MHSWQEVIFTLGSMAFVLALIPSVLRKEAPALSTSLMTGGILFLFAFCYFTMGFIFAGATTLATATLWATLAYQRLTGQVDE